MVKCLKLRKKENAIRKWVWGDECSPDDKCLVCSFTSVPLHLRNWKQLKDALYGGKMVLYIFFWGKAPKPCAASGQCISLILVQIQAPHSTAMEKWCHQQKHNYEYNSRFIVGRVFPAPRIRLAQEGCPAARARAGGVPSPLRSAPSGVAAGGELRQRGRRARPGWRMREEGHRRASADTLVTSKIPSGRGGRDEVS